MPVPRRIVVNNETNRERVKPLVPAVLARARDLLSDRTRWTAGANARDAHGSPVTTDSPDAVTWCAAGSIERCAAEVWRGLPEAAGWAEGVHVLAYVAQFTAQEYILTAAKTIRPSTWYSPETTIPHINDHDRIGGYQAVINGLCLATGKAPVDDMEVIKAAFEKRAAASRKGWEARRRREAAEAHAAHQRWLKWQAEQNAQKAAAQPMVIAGTNVPVSPKINADANKEITV